MKKTIIVLFALAGAASAAYTWNGGSEVTSDKWADSSNWIIGESDTFNGNGPGTTNSNMWDDIYVSSATGTVGNESDFTLEGWSLDLHLTNGADLTFQRVIKFQGGANINIDATSSLTFYSYYGGNDGEYINLNNKGSFTLGYSLRTQGGNGFVMNLYDTGIVTLKAQNTNGDNYAKVSSITAQLTGTATGIQERTLISITGEKMAFDETETTYSFTDANGTVMTAVDSLDALAAATAPSYFVTKDASGVKVSYNTAAVPEPTTATLSLLALAGLAARRRRK
ncbi:MAG: PEP-CTERM sorting domain-containing protein [Akkermansia sp.]|nr:PEP-CTERM sorting domain-containing protein [Akkermansia sp.]